MRRKVRLHRLVSSGCAVAWGATSCYQHAVPSVPLLCEAVGVYRICAAARARFTPSHNAGHTRTPANRALSTHGAPAASSVHQVPRAPYGAFRCACPTATRASTSPPAAKRQWAHMLAWAPAAANAIPNKIASHGEMAEAASHSIVFTNSHTSMAACMHERGSLVLNQCSLVG